MARPTTKAEYIKRLKVIYDNFDDKNLTWDEFRNQMLELDDPKAVARMRNEQRGRSSRIVIPHKKIIR